MTTAVDSNDESLLFRNVIINEKHIAQKQDSEQIIVGYTYCSEKYRAPVFMKEGELCAGKPTKQRGMLDKIFLAEEHPHLFDDATKQAIQTNSDKENRYCRGSCIYDERQPQTGLYTNFHTCFYLESIEFLDNTVARVAHRNIVIPNSLLK